jgi:hypothetical protein
MGSLVANLSVLLPPETSAALEPPESTACVAMRVAMPGHRLARPGTMGAPTEAADKFS